MATHDGRLKVLRKFVLALLNRLKIAGLRLIFNLHKHKHRQDMCHPCNLQVSFASTLTLKSEVKLGLWTKHLLSSRLSPQSIPFVRETIQMRSCIEHDSDSIQLKGNDRP